jgi:hypothetical protein
MMRLNCATLVFALSLAGCSSDHSTAPTPVAPPVVVSPLPPADQIVALSILGNQWIALNGGPAQMTARIFTRLGSNGAPSEYVDHTEHVAWSVEPAGVVTVDRQGRATPVASGSARVSATVGGRTSFNSIRVLPDYSGAWSGNYIITACQGGVDFRTCSRAMFGETPNRILYPFRLLLTQDRDVLTGTITTNISASSETVRPATGFVRLNGTLVLEVTVPQPGLEPFRITNWSSGYNSAFTEMSGAFTAIAPGRNPLGGGLYSVRTENEFSGVTRTP